jgi:hypothetical protein
MDVGLYLRVLWRFRIIVACGLVLSLVLALLTFVRVDAGTKHTLTYRQSQKWTSQSTIWVTQQGFPSGSVLPGSATSPTQATPSTGGSQGSAFEDPQRFTDLAVLYSQLVNTDQVRASIRRFGPIDGTIIAQPGFDRVSGDILPLIQLTATAASPEAAVALADRATNGLLAYLNLRQTAAGTPVRDRVVMNVMDPGSKPVLTAGRSKTKPIVVLFASMFAVLGLVALLENMRPTIRKVDSESNDSTPMAA